MSACVDFHGVAELIDTVVGVAPRRLGRLLHVLWSSDEHLEARVVVEIVLRCRDPLAPLSTLCRDALETARDLDRLLKARPWHRAEEVCRSVRASALLNLCDAILAEPTPYNGKRRGRIREIRPRVKVAAAGELNGRRAEIERIRETRDAALPNLWSLFATYLAKDKRTGLDTAS